MANFGYMTKANKKLCSSGAVTQTKNIMVTLDHKKFLHGNHRTIFNDLATANDNHFRLGTRTSTCIFEKSFFASPIDLNEDLTRREDDKRLWPHTQPVVILDSTLEVFNFSQIFLENRETR